MIRFYLVPVETIVDAKGTHRGPKYFPTPWHQGAPLVNQPVYAIRDYGDEPTLLIAADVSDVDDAALTAMADVLKFADNLDQTVGAQLATVQAALEGMNLPAQMVTAATTYRQVLRGILGILAIAQCMQGKGFRVFGAAITLSTTLSALPVAARQALQACAAELKYDQAGITLASTVRQVLTLIVQQPRDNAMMGVSV